MAVYSLLRTLSSYRRVNTNCQPVVPSPLEWSSDICGWMFYGLAWTPKITNSVVWPFFALRLITPELICLQCVCPSQLFSSAFVLIITIPVFYISPYWKNSCLLNKYRPANPDSNWRDRCLQNDKRPSDETRCCWEAEEYPVVYDPLNWSKSSRRIYAYS